MAIDSSAPRSRRAILGAALGGAGALFAHALGRATPAAAADGDSLLLGKGSTSATENAADTVTVVNSSADGLGAISVHGAGLIGRSGGPGVDPGYSTGVIGLTGDGSQLDNVVTDFTGVYGFSEDATNFTAAGVWGQSLTGTGVAGTGYTGVYGSGVIGAMGDVDEVSTGVYGFSGTEYPAPDPYAGAGVVGRAGTMATYGVVAYAPGATQYALNVVGKLKLSRSGRTSFTSTATSKKVTLAGVTTSSYVIATLQTSITGCYVRAVVCASGSFTIYLSKAPGKTAYVGYVVIN